MSKKKTLHPESLLQIPLVRQMLADPSIHFSPIGFDAYWVYSNYFSPGLSAFNPHQGKIFFQSGSCISEWLKNPEVSARPLNQRDFLVKEVLFAVHDYFHIWGYQLIQHLRPQLNFGIEAITKANFETFVFCHLLTEAIATIGLDYWYLSQVDLNEVVPIGTYSYPLATSYHKEDDSEFKRFAPNMNVMSVDFFETLMRTYLTGDFFGFSAFDLQRSPILIRWLNHELTYAEKQRSYTRTWLAHLSHQDLKLKPKNLKGHVSASAAWQKKMISDAAEILFAKVVHNKPTYLPALASENSEWSSRKNRKQIDYRFFNICSFGDDMWEQIEKHPPTAESRDHLYLQILSRHQFETFKRPLLEKLRNGRTNYDLKSLRQMLKTAKRISSHGDPLPDIFMLG